LDRFSLRLVLGTVAFFAACVWRRSTPADRWLVVALALSPILWVNLNFGQLGLILAMLFVGALRLLPTKPVIAGVMIGLLTIKPQLGLLLPLVLVLSGAGRAFAAAAVTALVLIALRLAFYGTAPWEAWWSETAPIQLAFVSEMKSFFVTQMTTPFIALRFLGASLATALAVQGLVATLVVAATWGVLRGFAPWPLKATVIAFGSVLISPYVLAYDLAIPLAALVWCLSSGSLRPSGLAAAAVVLVWAVPCSRHHPAGARPPGGTAQRAALLCVAAARGAWSTLARACARGALLSGLRRRDARPLPQSAAGGLAVCAACRCLADR
jgi:hypothetical protein